MRKRLDLIIEMLEGTEKDNPDPSAAAYDLIREISASDFDSLAWSVLLGRFAHSASSAVSAALAWALVEDAKGEAQADLGSVLRFAEALGALDHPSLAGGILAAVAARMPRTGIELVEGDPARLKGLLFRCFEFAGMGRFQVDIGILNVLERLNAAGALALVFGSEGMAEVESWLRSFAAREVGGHLQRMRDRFLPIFIMSVRSQCTTKEALW